MFKTNIFSLNSLQWIHIENMDIWKMESSLMSLLMTSIFLHSFHSNLNYISAWQYQNQQIYNFHIFLHFCLLKFLLIFNWYNLGETFFFFYVCILKLMVRRSYKESNNHISITHKNVQLSGFGLFVTLQYLKSPFLSAFGQESRWIITLLKR